MTPLRRDIKAARKGRPCDDHSHYGGYSGWIAKGAPYVRLSAPPRAEFNNSDHWWVLNLHPECLNWQEPQR